MVELPSIVEIPYTIPKLVPVKATAVYEDVDVTIPVNTVPDGPPKYNRPFCPMAVPYSVAAC
jgi:hypothetical protein